MLPITMLHPDLNIDNPLQLELTIPVADEDATGRLADFSRILDALPSQPILNQSWPDYATSCRASFSMLYTPQAFLLKYYIKNDFFRSIVRGVNEPVHLDNCIEFFVQFNDDPSYYNIEFNCLGSGKMGYGQSNKNRKYLSASSINKIETLTSSRQTGDRFDWEMALMIPSDSFEFHKIALNKALKCRGNFYKCGDQLPQPHFLTWSKIDAERPNFHRAEAFRPINLLEATVNNILDKNCVR